MSGEKDLIGADDGQNNDRVLLANFMVDEPTRQMIMDLQRHWLTEYHNSRERTLMELTQNLRNQFLADLHKYRADLHQQFKDEFEATKMEHELKLRNEWELETTKLMEKHKKELSAAKKKQWCWHCNNEAKYLCCWNTSYCGVNCQQEHWSTHREVCRRKKGNSETSGGFASAADPQAPSSSGQR